MRRALFCLLLLAGGALAATPPDEDEDQLYPFPPGPNAALARRVCSACHSANTVARRRYDAEDARRLYRVMVTSDLESATARRVISYLTTTLGDD